MRGEAVGKDGWKGDVREVKRGLLREVRREVAGEVMRQEEGERVLNGNRRHEKRCSREISVSREGK